MYTSSILVGLTAVLGLVSAQTTTDPVTGIQGNATIIENNPPGKLYTAVLPEKGSVKGSISAVASSNGIGVDFKVSFSNLPTSGGPFAYHIHAFPVSADGNCTSTLAHLDPFIRGETPICNASLPQTCQVGDLSGKYGKITSDPFEATYHDDFATTVEGLGAFFGNRSITLHLANKTRIACANFTLSGMINLNGTNPAPSGWNSTATASATTTAPPTQTSKPVTFSGVGAAGKQGLSMVGLVGALGVALLL